jgi:hypothetical protein
MLHRLPSPAAVLLDLPKLAMATSERSFPSTPVREGGKSAVDCANELQLDISNHMTKVREAEKRFEEYRDNLRREVGLLADYVHLFCGIQRDNVKCWVCSL